jgi:hypothetical protein
LFLLLFSKKIWLIAAFLFISWAVSGQGRDEKSPIKYIKKGDFESLRSYLEEHPEYNMDSNATLKWAIKYNRARIARLLIEYGADVNWPDEKHNTPLFYAAELNSLELCKILIDRGADPLHANLKGRRASDFAAHDSHSKTFGYLLFMEEEAKHLDSLPFMYDGPYIFLESESRLVLTYFEHLPETKLTRLYEKTLDLGDHDTIIKGLGRDKNTYHIPREYLPDSDSLETSGKIFVLGDIHGRYDALINLLINNRVIDRELNWIFEEGQLVLLGDVFDRGANVTEVLWYLHELQIQSRKAGGNVHLLLGNHEVMAMTGVDRYINSKYRHFTQYTQTYYSTLFEKNTVLGRWLRSRNVIVRINDYLFLHAGISPEFAAYDLDYSEVNSRVRQYLNSDDDIEEGSPEDIILGRFGPQWYRGYFNVNVNVNDSDNYNGNGNESYNDNDNDKISGHNNYPGVTQEFVDGYLLSKGLKRMILGHNEQAAITLSFDGKVISCDVAIDKSGTSAQGLLISGGDLFRCYSDGRRERIE